MFSIKFTFAKECATIKDMENDIRQYAQELSKWYEAFGIRHVFFEKDRITKKNTSQVEVTPKTSSSTVFETLEELRSAIDKIELNIKKSARNTVFSDGSMTSGLVLIGEAPGQEEDEQGKPFVGQSGQLLNNMLRAIGLERKDVYITNIVFWRPPGNRTPSQEEISICLPYVQNHLKLLQPKVMFLLGSVAVKAILNTQESITRLRGRTFNYLGIPAVATYHPAYLLRSPTQKALAFNDLLLIKSLLER